MTGCRFFCKAGLLRPVLFVDPLTGCKGVNPRFLDLGSGMSGRTCGTDVTTGVKGPTAQRGSRSVFNGFGFPVEMEQEAPGIGSRTFPLISSSTFGIVGSHRRGEEKRYENMFLAVSA